MTIGLLGSTILGGLGGLFGGGGGGGGATRQNTSQSTNWNQTQTTSPWEAFAPYLMGGEGMAGLFPEAQRIYAGGGWTPQMQDQAANWFNDTSNNRNIFRQNGTAQNVGGQVLSGAYDPRITAAGGVTPTTFDPQGARATQGVLDPTTAMQGFLKGDATNPWVEKQGQAITDTLTRNLKENVLPGIRHNAIAEGQYGGSRGDMAEGLALSRLSTDIAPALTQLAGNTYEAEQGRKYGIAGLLNQQATDVATGNANRATEAAKFNTGTQLQNNAQEMQRAAQVVGNRGAGLNFLGQSQDMTNQYYNDLLKSLNIGTDDQFNRLAQYGSLIQPGLNFNTTNAAGTSNTTGTSTGYTPGGGGGASFANAIGGAAAGFGIGNGLFGNNGVFGPNGRFGGGGNTAGSQPTDRGRW